MPSIINVSIAVIGLLVVHTSQAQYADTVKNTPTGIDTASLKINWQNATIKNAYPIKPLMIPVFIIAYGFTALESEGLRNFNTEIKDEVYAENPHKKIPIDNYLQFAPAVAVYGLNVAGIKGKHNFRDRSLIYLMSNIILNTTVAAVKKFSHQLRPDGSAYNSFPSGHTAEAFSSAEFLWQEYKNVSPWYGIAGYAIAVTTGYLRMYNNRHWFSDVAAGAGVGMVSTKIAYWLYPKIQHKLFKDKPVNTIVMPTYQQGSFGVSMVHTFYNKKG